MSRRSLASVCLALVAAFVFAACADCNHCIKDPPCPKEKCGCDAPAAK